MVGAATSIELLSPCWWISWWIRQVLGWFIPCSQEGGHKNNIFFTPAKRNPLWNAKSSVSGRTFSSFLVPVLGPNKGTPDDTDIGHPLSKSYKEVLIWSTLGGLTNEPQD